MKVCPSCSSEFVDAATRCNDCDVELKRPDEIATEQDYEDARDELEGKETVRLSVGGGLDAARELERMFHKEGIVCFVDGEEGDAAVLSAAPMHYFIVVGKDQADRVGQVLKGNYEDMIAREGVGALVTTAVDLESSEVTCPACGHIGALVDGGCGDCGLHLAAPE